MAKITVEIDSKVLAKAMRRSKGMTKKQVINEALRAHAQRLAQDDFFARLASGNLGWNLAPDALDRFLEYRRSGRAAAKRAALAQQRPARKAA